jgi:hypothetical protein
MFSWGEFLQRLAKHTLLAMVGGVTGWIVLVAIFEPIFPGRLGDQWYGPCAWLSGLALGFFVNRHLLHRAACFAWIPGLLFLGWVCLGEASVTHAAGVSAMESIRIGLFPTTYSDFSACGTSECLAIVVITIPVLNTITYSVGAWLALRSQAGKRLSEDKSAEFTTLGLS